MSIAEFTVRKRCPNEDYGSTNAWGTDQEESLKSRGSMGVSGVRKRQAEAAVSPAGYTKLAYGAPQPPPAAASS